MTEQRFKLKKEGKCVGYMRIMNGEVEATVADYPTWRDQYYMEDTTPPGSYEACQDIRKLIDFDSIHPLVCPDRHSKDCYEGDAVRYCGQDGILFYRKEGADWAIRMKDNIIGLWEATNLPEHDFDIELIEEQT